MQSGVSCIVDDSRLCSKLPNDPDSFEYHGVYIGCDLSLHGISYEVIIYEIIYLRVKKL